MSYDIYLYDARAWAHRGECDWRVDHECHGHVVDCGNITYNIAPMWADALKVADGIHRFDAVLCAEAAGPLLEAAARMEDDPDRYRVMNPANGWGNYEWAVAYLKRLAELCAIYPEYRIHVG